MSEPTYLIRVAETMREIQRDCEQDASAIDGTPFTGKAVGESFGATLAMLAVVAKALGDIAEVLDALLTESKAA